MGVPYIMDAYEGYVSFFCSALHIATDKALCKCEYPVRWHYTVYFMGIMLYFFHDCFRHGNSADAVIGLGRCYNIAT